MGVEGIEELGSSASDQQPEPASPTETSDPNQGATEPTETSAPAEQPAPVDPSPDNDPVNDDQVDNNPEGAE